MPYPLFLSFPYPVPQRDCLTNTESGRVHHGHLFSRTDAKAGRWAEQRQGRSKPNILRMNLQWVGELIFGELTFGKQNFRKSTLQSPSRISPRSKGQRSKPATMVAKYSPLSVVPKLAGLASVGGWLERKFSRPAPDLLSQNLREWGPAISV